MRHSRLARPLIAAFFPVTALVLALDSVAASRQCYYCQWFSNGLTLFYVAALVGQMEPGRKLEATLFVPLSAGGEVIFSLMLRLYHYRLDAIPLYVPLGHAVILSVGLAAADDRWVKRHARPLWLGLAAFHALAIAVALLWRGDTLSALFGVGLLALLPFVRRPTPLYLIVGVLVLYVEVLGTMWGCWRWGPAPFGVLHTINPPVGAFTCYVVAEILAMRCAATLRGAWGGRQGRGWRVAAAHDG